MNISSVTVLRQTKHWEVFRYYLLVLPVLRLKCFHQFLTVYNVTADRAQQYR